MRTFQEYEPIPFYFLNDDLDKEELVRQLDCMQKNGVSAYFLHVRDGVENKPWGTARFFEDVRFIVEESVKRNIKVWLYDEDSYPSGQAGGAIIIDRPELAARGLQIKALKNVDGGYINEKLGIVKGLCAYVVSKRNGVEKVRKIEDCFGPVRPRWYKSEWDSTYFFDMFPVLKNEHIRAATTDLEIVFECEAEKGDDIYIAYLTPVPSDRYRYLADCLNLETTKEFIRRVHEKYKACVGEYFGKEIPGIFIDEPAAGGALPYTAELAVVFREKYGYSIEDNYYKLSRDYEGGEQARRDYADCAAELFRKNFLQPIRDWCQENGLIFTGHFSGEEDPLAQLSRGQSIYRNSAYLDIQGFDIIATNLGTREYPALIYGANLIASQAAQCGKEKVLAECFALSPFNMGYRGLRRIADWLYAVGISTLVPHAFHYAYCNYHRMDAGKSFFFQDKYFEDYKRFAGYAGRVGKLLLEYERKGGVLVVYPDGACAEQAPYDRLHWPVGVKKLWDKIADTVRYLSAEHVAWDLCDTRAVIEGKAENGRLIVGKRTYDKVVVISGGDKEENAYRSLLERGVSCALFEGTNFDCFPAGRQILGDAEDVLLYQKVNDTGTLLFLYNNAESYTKIQLKASDKPLWVYDAETDETYSVQTENGYATLSLQANGALILLESETPYTPAKGIYKPEPEKPVPAFTPEWTYLPRGARSAITVYTLTAVENGKRKEFSIKPCRIRDALGTQDENLLKGTLRNAFDRAPRMKPIYPRRVEYKASVVCVDKKDYILFDRQTVEGQGKIFWNGEEVTEKEIKSVRIYDASNKAFYPKWKDGENVLSVLFEEGKEFDGVSGEFYVMSLENAQNETEE